MVSAADITVRGKVWRIWVTDERFTYQQWVREGKVCFSEHELGSIMDQEPSQDDMHWALVIKEVSPGTKIEDIKERKIVRVRRKKPELPREPEDAPF